MLPAETRGAAARRQSDRPPCTSDPGDAEAPPSQRHPITPAQRGPLWQVLSLILAGGFVVAVLRAGLVGTDTPSAARQPQPSPSSPRPTADPDGPFTTYLVSSIEDVYLLKTMLDRDRAEVRVVTSSAEEMALREELRAANATRLDSGFGEIEVVDLRIQP